LDEAISFLASTLLGRWFLCAAFFFFTVAAQADNHTPKAQHELGVQYLHGHGVSQDSKRAVLLFRRAAAGAYPPALNALGELYRHGNGVRKSARQAKRLFERAAEQNYAPAQTNLGDVHRASKVFGGAAHWYRLAATQGSAPGQYRLGRAHWKGEGVPTDEVRAYKWLTLAAQQGYKAAVKDRDVLAKTLTAGQIEKADGLVAQWTACFKDKRTC